MVRRPVGPTILGTSAAVLSSEATRREATSPGEPSSGPTRDRPSASVRVSSAASSASPYGISLIVVHSRFSPRETWEAFGDTKPNVTVSRYPIEDRSRPRLRARRDGAAFA